MTQSPGEAPDEGLLDELSDQFGRTRRLLTGDVDEAAAQVLARLGGQSEVEARIAAALASRLPLAYPERFAEAHRTVMRALEVLDREGSRDPTVPPAASTVATTKRPSCVKSGR